MQIEITGETAKLVQAILATGEYSSVDDFVAAMAKKFQRNDGSERAIDTYAAQSIVAGLAGWDDDEMDIYNNYDSKKAKN